MKTLLLLLLATNSYANNCSSNTTVDEAISYYNIDANTPNHLKGATITVTLANGKSSTVPAERFKVVPRFQQYIIKTAQNTTTETCTINDPNKNRVSALGGYGSRNKLSTSTTGNTVEVENSRGLVGGLQYQRLITDVLSVGAQAQTNKTGLLLIGLDF